MNTEQLKMDYMNKYSTLLQEFKDEDIHRLVTDLNDAVENSKIEEINKLYNSILIWNNKVAGLEAIREAINTRYSYLHLPSVKSMAVVLDGQDKIWKFDPDNL